MRRLEKPVNAVLIILLALVAILIVFLFFEFQELDFTFEDDISLNFTIPQDEPEIRESPHINNTKPILIAPTENNFQQKHSLNLLPQITNPEWKVIDTVEYSKPNLGKGVIEKVTRHYSDPVGIIFFISVLRTESSDYAMQFYNKDMFNFYMMQNHTEQLYVSEYYDVIRHVDADQCYAYKVEIIDINYGEFMVNCIKQNFYFRAGSFINGTYVPDNFVLDLANAISENIDSLE